MSSAAREVSTIMVVDDTADVRELMGLQLRMLGYRVVEARDGQEAVELAKRKCPALILMDLNMPVLDGLTATRAIRQLKETCRIPIVAFSAYSDSSYSARALEAGCNEFVSKTEGINQLQSIVERHLQRA